MTRLYHDPDRTVEQPWRGAASGESAHDTDKHNLSIIRKDPLLQRLLTRWRCIGPEDRELVVALAEEMPDVAPGDADGT